MVAGKRKREETEEESSTGAGNGVNVNGKANGHTPEGHDSEAPKKKKRKTENGEDDERQNKDKKEKHKKDKEKKSKKYGDEANADEDEDAKKKTKKKDKKKKKKKHTDSDEVAEDDTKKGSSDFSDEVYADNDDEPTPPDDGESDANPLISTFRVDAETVELLRKQDITRLFPIQALTFDHIFDGKDVVARARTGTGKTLAYALPIIEALQQRRHVLRLAKPTGQPLPRVLVLVPTRELATQVATVFEQTARLASVATVYGGTAYSPQAAALRRGVDVVVGTPGRVKDLIDKGLLRLGELRYVVLDEADEMLNIGFADDVEQILSQIGTAAHQTLLFSATMPEWVRGMVRKHCRENAVVHVDLVGDAANKTAESVTHLALACPPSMRRVVLPDVIKVYGPADGRGRTIVFTNTKAEANELVLNSPLADAQVLHGDIVQAQRDVTMAGFRDGKFSVLVATNVAARGLDISGVDLIVQCSPPPDVETYIHRAGRTGRAGRSGTTVTLFGRRDLPAMKRIEAHAGIKFTRIGAPQPGDVARATAAAAVAAVDAVDPAVLPLFAEAAKRLLRNGKHAAAGGAESVVAAALAKLCGYERPLKRRSLLSAEEGYATVLVRSPREIFSPGYVLGVLEEALPAAGVKLALGGSGMRGIARDVRFCDEGAVVDLPEEMAVKLVEAGVQVRGGIAFELPTSLPASLRERDEQQQRAAERGFYGSGGRGGYGGPGRGAPGLAGAAAGGRGWTPAARGGGANGFSNYAGRGTLSASRWGANNGTVRR